MLARSEPADRLKAIGYVEQAVGVIEENNEGDDVSWLGPGDRFNEGRD